jgi:predicted nucleic acid-binding protein
VRVFADTLYWVALLTPGDRWHIPAVAAYERITGVELVTTDEVLIEVLTNDHHFTQEGFHILIQ